MGGNHTKSFRCRVNCPPLVSQQLQQSGSLLTNLQIDASHLINAVTTLTSFSKWRKLLFLLDDSSKAQNIERLLGGMDVDDTQILLLQRFDLDSAVNFIQRNPCDVLIYCCDPYVLYEMLQREKMKVLKQNWILLDEALSRQANLINIFPTGMLGIRQIPLKSNKQTLKATLLMLNEITKSLPKVGFLGNISCWRGGSPKRRRYSEQLKERILQQVNSNLNNRLTFDGGGGRSLQPIFEVLNLVDKKFRFKRNPGKITSRKINKSKFNDAEGSKSYIQAISATQYVDIEETSELLQEFLGSAVYTNSVSIVNELERKKISYEDSKTTENQRLYLVNEFDNKEDIDIYMSEIKPNIKPKKLETKKHQFKNESSSIKNFNFIALKDEHNNKQRAQNPNTVTAQTSIEDKSVVSAFNVVKKSKKTPKKLTALGLISHPIVFPVNIVTKIDQTKNVEDSETDSLDPVRIDEMLKKSNKRINDEDKLSYEVEADSNYDDSMKYFTLRYNRSRVEAHKYWKYIGNITSTLNFNVVIWPTGTLSSVARNKAMYKVVTTLLSPFVMEDKSKDKCLSGLECIILPEGIFNVLEDANWNRTKWKTCCYGLSIDLIIKLSNDLGISFQLYLLEGYRSTRTEKLIREIERGVIHLSFAPLNPSSSRSKAIDFSVPYFYSGLSFLANIDNDDVSLLAFLEPFSMDLWIVIFVSLNLTAIVVAVYEWLSPFGLNPYGRQRTKNFSLASALWVMWGLLFSHLVQFKAPKSWPNKFLINVWGGFSVIFLASYTANIAALFAGIFAHGPVTNFGDANVSA
ncbi:uncharacterized protein LOC136032754 isoform X2 [Artemia franciscana]|uniref:uncharacterized protein LOC136032754 isoform X2 n=1 Tax=Artemia franciscana TaxID=6661 RepID=UPI0032DAC564